MQGNRLECNFFFPLTGAARLWELWEEWEGLEIWGGLFKMIASVAGDLR